MIRVQKGGGGSEIEAKEEARGGAKKRPEPVSNFSVAEIHHSQFLMVDFSGR